MIRPSYPSGSSYLTPATLPSCAAALHPLTPYRRPASPPFSPPLSTTLTSVAFRNHFDDELTCTEPVVKDFIARQPTLRHIPTLVRTDPESHETATLEALARAHEATLASSFGPTDQDRTYLGPYHPEASLSYMDDEFDFLVRALERTRRVWDERASGIESLRDVPKAVEWIDVLRKV